MKLRGCAHVAAEVPWALHILLSTICVMLRVDGHPPWALSSGLSTPLRESAMVLQRHRGGIIIFMPSMSKFVE